MSPSRVPRGREAGRGRVRGCGGTWPRTVWLLGALLAFPLIWAPGARAQTSLGGQRIGTSSGTFLKIGLDARSAALGGAAIAVIQGPGAVFGNPAGLLDQRGGTTFYASYMQWPADIQISAFCLSQSVPSIDSQFALALAFLGTDLEETNEYYPQGTGRTLSYSDMTASLAFARNFTDRLAIGVTAKYFREDEGSNLGGPTMAGILVDAGSTYSMGYRNAKLSIALSDFGADLRPSGDYLSNVTGAPTRYAAFSPPTLFQLGFAIDPWISGGSRLTTAVQVMHQSDKQETLRAGAEYWLRDTYAARAGYDLASDEMGFSAGLGLKVHLLNRPGTVDYAYTEGGHLAAVHRWSLCFRL
jgi:hypothetical protein